MKTAKARSIALVGIEGICVQVEAAWADGLPHTELVGLADISLKEAQARCKAALGSSGVSWPYGRVTINLSPAYLPKMGTHFDLAICTALAACVRDDLPEPAGVLLFGEVGLDGTVRAVRGLLPGVIAAARQGVSRVVVPAVQMREASLVEGMDVVGVGSLAELWEVLRGGPGASMPEPVKVSTAAHGKLDLADVTGQPEARWALEVAAAGGHHLYFHGPPGAGKTMLAERLPTLLPPLSEAQALEVSAIHSLAGEGLDAGLIQNPPYSDPHPSSSLASIVGGGAQVATPGAISLAHRGVLFLDEAPEFPPKVLDSLRAPLESGRVVISRQRATTVYPARFQLVLAANPCPCGKLETRGAACKCTPQQVRKYANRISGPVLDRIDIHQHVRPLSKAFACEPAEGSAAVAQRVEMARERQRARLSKFGMSMNCEVPGRVLRKELPLPDVDVIEQAVRMGRLSARGADKVLRLAWTVADLSGQDVPGEDELNIALAMRQGS
ncbi:MAG: YifB family Mg chelatase-like AAA ATPase [Propionibacteriaceae bacterium]|jgi:magnesium chelatase family protein|nr:YifB family Mg chelatase-like AAA ATPase [Propionibacteriaceae bacterium]